MARPSPRGHMELTDMPSQYQPPNYQSASAREPASTFVQNHNVVSLHRLPPMPANANPAPDLAWSICSHGLCCVQCVRTQEIGFLEEWGAFQSILSPGLYCLPWPMQRIPKRLTLRLQQLSVVCESRSKDNVFVHMTVTVLYRVAVDQCYEACYRVVNPILMLQTFVLDVVRGTLPNMTLEEIFESVSSIADTVRERLVVPLVENGYELTSVLVKKIEPTEKVKESMNEVNAARRRKEAASHKGEADKVMAIKHAEGEAERTYLHGIGLAKARSAIVDGMKTSVNEWTQDVRQRNPQPKEIMNLLLVSQYLDLLHAVSSNHLMISPDPGHIQKMRDGLPG